MTGYVIKHARLLLIIFFTVLFVFGCSSSESGGSNGADSSSEEETTEGNDSSEDNDSGSEGETDGSLTFGYIAYDMKDVWNMYSAEAFEYAGDQLGVETIILDSENDLEKSVQQMESLVQRGVDGISIFPITPDQAVTLSNIANDAGIPVTFENLPPADHVGDYISVVAAEYNLIGEAAFEFIAETWPNSKVLFAAGTKGGGVYESYQEGINKALESVGDQVEIVETIHGDWETEKTMNEVQNVIQSGLEFDVIFANNELMAKGAMNALREAGLENDIKIVSTGGGPDGMDMIRNGELTATMSAPVSLQGLITFRNLYRHINGDPVEEYTPLPIIPITTDNVDEAISWEADETAVEHIGGLE